LTAAKYDIGVSIAFSHSANHYVRVYATIQHGAKKADENIKNMGYIFHCFKCFHREPAKGRFLTAGSEKCSECGSKINVAGPLWLGKICDEQFCELIEEEAKHRAFKRGQKIRRILTLIKDEVDAPLTYYVLDKLCDVLALPVPPVREVVEALREKGFQAFLTHFNSRGIKSNVPATEIKELLREILG